MAKAIVSKQADIVSKQAYIVSKEACIVSKEAHIASKEACIARALRLHVVFSPCYEHVRCQSWSLRVVCWGLIFHLNSITNHLSRAQRGLLEQ